MLPNFTDISYFIEVSQTLNISRAAERLGIAQPSLSSAIRRLEDVVGVQLLNRSRTGVQLTKSGKDFVGKSRQLLAQWEQLKVDANRKQTAVSGKYVLGCHPSVALYSLPGFLPKLTHQHPDLEIQLVHDLSRKITERVISFEVDFGIVVNPVRHPDLVVIDLCTDEVTFWVAKKPSLHQNLDPEQGILICDDNLLQVQKLRADLQKKKLGFRRLISSGSLEVVASLTAAGAGVGILPGRVATHHKEYQLKTLAPKMPIFKDKVCLVYRADSQKTKASRTLIDAIKNGFS